MDSYLALVPYPHLLIPVLTVIFGLLLRRAYYAIKPTETHHGVPRPPLVPSWIPYIGHAVGLAAGDAFWVKAVARYGTVFRCHVLGDTRTFVTTPAIYSHIYKASKTFDFYHIRKTMQNTIFGMDLEIAHSPVMDDKLFASHHRGMQPGMIGGAVGRYVDQLLIELGSLGGGVGESGVVVDMAKEVYALIYTASSKAWFSPSFPAAKTLPPFLKFDAAFPILNLASLPSIIRSPAKSARSAIHREIQTWWETVKDGDKSHMAPALLGMLEIAESEGWDGMNWSCLLLTELWALEANAPLAGIWTIAEIYRRPLLLKKCQTEIQYAILSLPTPTLSNLLHLPLSALQTTLPTIQASIQETLRLHTSSFSLRVVKEDTVLPGNLLDGRKGSEDGYSLKKGEEVVCVTRYNQIDERGDWGSGASAWDCERFLQSEGKKWEKGSMAPFGGGVSMCEGRHFASSEILTFVAAFIHLFEPSIREDTLKEDMTRMGLGVMYSTGSMRANLKRREAM